MIPRNTFLLGNCLEWMKEITDKSVDMILADLPYEQTECEWDSMIPLQPLWVEYKRILKINGAILLTANFAFGAKLYQSEPNLFRYDLVWNKVNKYTGALNANRMPLRRHELVLVFYRKLPTYNKQLREGRAYATSRTQGHGLHTHYGNPGDKRSGSALENQHNPCSILPIPADNKKELGIHPTQKPIALFEYLIKTYSNEGDLILDNVAGSGTTAIACLNTKRDYILIEKDEEMYVKAAARIEAYRQRVLTV